MCPELPAAEQAAASDVSLILAVAFVKQNKLVFLRSFSLDVQNMTRLQGLGDRRLTFPIVV